MGCNLKNAEKYGFLGRKEKACPVQKSRKSIDNWLFKE